MISVLVSVVVFAWYRKRKGKILVIEKDFRNPYKGSRKYLLLYDKSINGLRLYSNVFKPKSDKLIPTFERDPFLWDSKVIYAYQGVSGNPDDDNIVPIHKPIVSQAGALQQAKEISNSLVNTMNFLAACKDYRNSQRAIFTIGADKQVEGIIKHIGYDGVQFEYTYINPKTNEPLTKSIVFNELTQLKQLKPVMVKDEDEKEHPDLWNTPAPSTEDFLTTEWVINNYGIVPVEDVNVMLAKTKDAIASFNSAVNDRIMSHASWITRNATTVMIIVLVFVLAITNSILIYQWSQSMAIAVAAAHGGSAVTTHAVSILPNVTKT
jgi:hypothetical protein